MIATLLITILVESSVAAGYAIFRRKPAVHLLLACLAANLLTQSLLWLALQVFFRDYLITLFIAEFWIWMIESAILFLYPRTGLKLREALGLSLAMNLASFAIGWFLAV